jgi:hypothetical protein
MPRWRGRTSSTTAKSLGVAVAVAVGGTSRRRASGPLILVDGRALGTTSPRLEAALAAGPLERSRSIVSRWWFWTAVGLAVAGGVVLTYALTTEKSAGHGTRSPGQVGRGEFFSLVVLASALIVIQEAPTVWGPCAYPTCARMSARAR